MKRSLKFAFLLLAVSNCVVSRAAPLQEVSFQEAYDLAKDYAPDVAIAQYDLERASANSSIAMSKILPQVGMFGQWSSNNLEYEQGAMFPDQNYPGKRYGIQVTQALLRTSDGLEASRSKSLEELSAEQLKIAENELLANLIEAFLSVLLAQSQKSAAASEVAAVMQREAEASALYEKQLLPVTQLLETRSRLHTVEADEISASASMEIARERLTLFTGQQVTPQNTLSSFSLFSTVSTADDAATLAVSHSDRVSAAEKSLRAAELAVSRERATWLPNIDLSLSYQHSDIGFDNLSAPARDTSIVSIGFNYPLFEGGARFAKIKKAKAELGGARVKLEAEIRESSARARAGWLNLRGLEQRLISTKSALAAAQANVDATTEAVRAGVATFSDSLMTLAQRTAAETTYNEAKFMYVMGWVELQLSIGINPDTIVPRLSKILHGG